MTKEETVSYLKAYLDGDTAIGNIIPLRSVLESALEYLEPSLPSNLDEAANDYCSAYYDWDDEGERKEVVRTFKAGAEWHVEQMPKWKPAAMAYEGDRLPRYDWQLDRIIARDEDGIYYLTMKDLYRLPKEKAN